MIKSGHFIPYGKHCIEEDDIAAVVAVLKSDYLTQGPAVEAFESALAAYAGARYAVAFSSGTAALHASYHAAGVRAGDEVITSPITFAATANAALYLGARPVFADVEPDTGNLDTDALESAITPRTRVIVPVHYAGHPVAMDRVYAIARKHRLMVIEDACHALGARYEREKIGSCAHADMAVFSFHPVKHITTGEGGAVLTNSREVYDTLRQFRTHGITKERFTGAPDGEWYYEMQLLGYNYRMTDMQAALGASQLKKLDRFVARRREIADAYLQEFRDNPFFRLPVERDYATSSFHLFPIQLEDSFRDRKSEIFSKLKEAGLGVQVHYIPVYLHPCYQALGYTRGLCPSAEDFYQREISIPLYPSMSDEEVTSVIERVRLVFDRL